MKAIVAVDSNWGIGFNNNLLEMIPEDMKFFKEKTIGKVIIMGRETFESLPEKKPLKNRINIVLSRDDKFEANDVIICKSLNELFLKINKYDKDEIFVIGGGNVYKQLLPFCRKTYVTKIKNKYEADTHFVNLDNKECWSLVFKSKKKLYKDIEYYFSEYENRQIKRFL